MLGLPDGWVLPPLGKPISRWFEEVFFYWEESQGKPPKGRGPRMHGAAPDSRGLHGPDPTVQARAACAPSRGARVFSHEQVACCSGGSVSSRVAGVCRRRAVFSWNLGSGPLSSAVVPSHCRQGAGASALHPGRPHAGVALAIDMPACHLLADTPLPCPGDLCWAFQVWSLDGSRPLATSEPWCLRYPPASHHGGEACCS